ncbi:hypothetical protein GCM10011506_30340 [Marivirga lumbricoides]|uniref:Glycosyltransferase subfamily 4-like N-terminal domain-containing protein n=1 Tax=Marivirga lumbricoides TaxID=1046115 RepID=A0ABQ1MQD1_9BACT|nr:hypothetical protein GCM10011506_30340 [Marivirga lumbricoides]
MKNTIFIFAYYSFKDPVFQSAVLPYLKAIQSNNTQYILLTWEQKQFSLSKIEIKKLENELTDYNIIWKRTSWHSGSFKLIKKFFDFTFGLFYSYLLIQKYKVTKVFSEGFPGAIIGHYLSKLSRKPHIIHTFEPHADYMLESGVWQKSSWEYRYLKKMELPIARHAQHIITATFAYKNKLIEEDIKTQIHIIPSCINMSDYYFDEESRLQIRNQLNIREDQITIVYLGKIGGMYMEDELFNFIQHCLKLDSDKFHFLLLTNRSQDLIDQKLNHYGIACDKVKTKYLKKEEVKNYLSAADIGFCGIRPIPSRRFSSPIKNGEYWACGLPTLIPVGISDDYLIIEKENIGLAFSKIEEISLNVIEDLLSISRTKTRTIALRERDINSYIDKWGLIFSN